MITTNRINSADAAGRPLVNALNQVVGSRPAAANDKSALERSASQVVAQTFFGTLLKQMQNSPFKSEMFSGGRGGQAFGSMFNDHLALRMARGSEGKLTRALVKRYEKMLAKPETQPPKLDIVTKA